ncbi:MAG: ATP-grasp domain-containing protein [Patescibacteria group bacterium]|jgi:D-alanine-D-alanine ligase
MNGNGHELEPLRDSLSGKTVLIVNTSSANDPQHSKKFFIKKTKSFGVKIIVLGKEANTFQPIADYCIVTDSLNYLESLAALEQFLKNNPTVKLDGVITFLEDDVLLTAKIADRYKLIGTPYKVANRIRNKYSFREFCVTNHLPVVKYKELKNNRDLEEIIKTFNFPLVVKPAYGAASAFVMKVDDEEELRESYNYIKKTISPKVEPALNDGLDVFVEEYIDGDEVDLDILIQNGKIKFGAISDNGKTKEPFFIETTRMTPSNLPPKNQAELMAMADETLEKLGVLNGCIHFEAKSTPHGPIPLEINLRPMGDEGYPSIKAAWHVDLIENYLKIACGIYIPKFEFSNGPYEYLVAETFSADYSGILVNWHIDEDLKKRDFVKEFQFEKKIGDSVLSPPDGYEYLGWILVSGHNPLDAQDNLREAGKAINYEVARFHPASSIGKTARKTPFSVSVINREMIQRGSKIEKIRRMEISNQRNLHIGIACNLYQETGENQETVVEKDLTVIGQDIEKTLKERGYKISFFDFNDLPKAFDELKDSDVDLVFNVCERINNSSLLEPHVASILDTLQIPYTGSNPFTLGLCIDKIRVKKLLSYHKIPTPEWDYVYSLEDDIRDDLRYPLIVKPANTDNSIGITNDSVVRNKEELNRQLEKVIKEIGRPALIEEYIDGDEYDVPIIGTDEDDLRVLPLSRSIFDELPSDVWHIYPFEAKYTDDSVYNKIMVQRPPKNIGKKLETLLGEIALDTYNILDCHDYGRVEIRVDKNNNPYVLELNPNPSLDNGGFLTDSAEMIGLDYGDFLEEIIRLAINRYKDNPPYYHLQPNIM